MCICGFLFLLEKVERILVTVIKIPDCILVVKISFPVTPICKQSSVFKREVKKKKGKMKQGAVQLFLLLLMQKDNKFK